MKKIEFLDSFVIGHPDIDADHRRIVDAVNDITEAIQADGCARCQEKVAIFLDVVREHFEREEAVLRENGYPDLADHVSYHHRLIEKARRVEVHCVGMQDRAALDACYDEMVSFLIDDVIRGDLEFKSFLMDKGAVPRGD